MKVLAVKGVEKDGDFWAVRYTRLARRGAAGVKKQDAYFYCETEEEALAKYQELVDVLTHHDGVYVSKNAKRKARTGREHGSEKRKRINTIYAEENL